MSAFDQRQAEADAAASELELETSERQRQSAEKDLKERDVTIARLSKALGILERTGLAKQPPAWTHKHKARRRGRPRAVPHLMLSDLHLDEKVEPGEMNHVNAYNRAIAEQRLETTFRSAVKITKEYWTGIDYDGFTLCMGGDIFTGNIHEELTETNEDTVLGSLDYWLEPMARGIGMLADEFGKVFVPSVAGNHGRLTVRKRFKLQARDNFDWFFAKQLQRQFAHDKRVTFLVSEAQDLLFPAYHETILMTHGDQTGGGQGIGGIWPPIMRMVAKKQSAAQAVGQPFDRAIMGHWHQLVWGLNFIVNGSLKGFDEFALGHNFMPEPAQQGLWLQTPEHGMTWQTPVISANRAKEGW